MVAVQDFQALAAERYSVRSYQDQPVEQEKLDLILEAGRIAPTACNNQPQRIKAITAPADLAKVDACTPCRFGAPAVLLICYDKNACWVRSCDQQDSGQVDASIVTTHMMLQAQALGLGTCWVMYFDPAKTAEAFDLPAHIVPVALLPLGYPDEDAAPAKQHGSRVPLDKLLL
jgi:nitroreductase